MIPNKDQKDELREWREGVPTQGSKDKNFFSKREGSTTKAIASLSKEGDVG
jgi:hypothetical protein